MKNTIRLFALLPVLAGCDLIFPAEKEKGSISVRFEEALFVQTRAAAALPDTNSFILTVTDSKGKTLYNGAYGSVPDGIAADPGTYTVTAVSSEFSVPKFSAPQYGDTQSAKVEQGRTTVVSLVCRQMNAGVKLDIAPAFLTAYPGGVLFLKSDDGRLMYSYSEKRIAYFRPGNISLILNNDNTDEVLLTRSVAPQEILSLKVGVRTSSAVNSSGGSKITIQVDTSRIWMDESYTIGDSSVKGAASDNPLSVTQAREMIGSEGLWVSGYIVGGDLTSTACSFSAPFSSATNLVLATRSSVRTKSACLSVQLPKGTVRDALNLQQNPLNLGREVALKGNIVESYYGIPGLQNVTEFEWR